MEAQDGLRFPGLQWRKRKGRVVPYWFAPAADIRDGYPIKSANLGEFINDLPGMSARCQHLHAEVLMWRRHKITTAAGIKVLYDGTFGSLIDIWMTDPESPFHGVKPGTKHPYTIYAAKLKRHIGSVLLRETDGRNVKRWFAVWSDGGKHVAAGRMAVTVLKAALSFGIICKNQECVSFKPILAELTFGGSKPRDVAPTAEQVIAVRQAAHAAGAPSRALAYALQFETTLRQWDLIGQWVPMSDPRPSAVIDRGEKWIGPHWHQVDENLIFRTVHGKTEGWTDARGVYDLSACPMVKEELDRIPPEKRTGPLIVNERTGLPYRYENKAGSFKEGWKADFKAAGLPSHYWNRDFRAGGNTEASKGRAHKEDRAKVSGHSTKINAQVYDRDTLEAHRRVMHARLAVRNGEGK